MRTEAEHAVRDLLERGPISRDRAASYERALNALVAAKIARRTREGGYELTSRATVTRLRRTEPPLSEGEELTVDLPADCIAILDALASTRGEAIAVALRPYLGSGVWRRR